MPERKKKKWCEYADFAANIATVIGVVSAYIMVFWTVSEIKKATTMTAISTMAQWQQGQDNGFMPLIRSFTYALETEMNDKHKVIKKALYNNHDDIDIPVKENSENLMIALADISFLNVILPPL